MDCDLDRGNPIFEGQVPVKLEGLASSNSVIRSREDRDAKVIIRVLSGSAKTPQGNRQGILHMEITEEKDSFFLYTLQVSDEDFHDLKHDQCLLVDFESFPGKFVELLECCINSEKQGNGRFIAFLDVGERPVLRIVEANLFKHLTHLALKFQPGTDQTVKSYLAGRLKQTHQESERRKELLEDTNARLEQQTEEYNRVRRELEDLKQRVEREREQMMRDHKAEMEEALNKQKQESIILLSQTQNAASEQALKMQKNSETHIEELEHEVKELAAAKKHAETEMLRLESENHKLSTRVALLEQSCDANNSELQRLRETNRKLEAQVFEMEKRAVSTDLSLDALKTQVKDKEDSLANLQALLDAATERRNAAEEKLVLYKSSSAKLQRKLEVSIGEINKGNTIIEKQQAELKQGKAKLKTKITVIKQQEKYVEKLKETIDKQEREVFRLEELVAREKDTVSKLKISLETCHKKLEESNKMLESNQNVIAYLNKEINQAQMGGPSFPISARTDIGLIAAGTPVKFDRFQDDDNAVAQHPKNPNATPMFPRSPNFMGDGGGEFAMHLAASGFQDLPDPDEFLKSALESGQTRSEGESK